MELSGAKGGVKDKSLKLTGDSRVAILQIDVVAMVEGVGYFLLVGN